jgi:hypothetical protein
MEIMGLAVLEDGSSRESGGERPLPPRSEEKTGAPAEENPTDAPEGKG